MILLLACLLCACVQQLRCFHLALSIVKSPPPLKEPVLGIVPVTEHISLYYTFRDWENNHRMGSHSLGLTIRLSSKLHALYVAPQVMVICWVSRNQQKLRTSIWKLSEYMATSLSQGQCQSGKRALNPLGKAQGEKSQCISVVLLQASISVEGLYLGADSFWERGKSLWIPAIIRCICGRREVQETPVSPLWSLLCYQILSTNLGACVFYSSVKNIFNFPYNSYLALGLFMLGRKSGMSNEGWPSWKGCKLISKPYPRHMRRTHRYATKITTGTFPTLHMYPRHTVDTD